MLLNIIIWIAWLSALGCFLHGVIGIIDDRRRRSCQRTGHRPTTAGGINGRI